MPAHIFVEFDSESFKFTLQERDIEDISGWKPSRVAKKVDADGVCDIQCGGRCDLRVVAECLPTEVHVQRQHRRVCTFGRSG